MKADAEARVCEANLVALQAGFNNCVMDESMSDCLDTAGQPFLTNIALGNLKTISCPSDLGSPVKVLGASSYGYNSALGDLSYKQYQRMPSDLIIIGDCESTTFSLLDSDRTIPLVKRHTKYELTGSKTIFALAVTKATRPGVDKGKRIKKITDLNESCHAGYQNCLANWFDSNKNADPITSPYSSCLPDPECSSDYQ
ncbi:MAG: hypothetical protein NT033_05830 [Candidatus Omnitrophica bacterium]|nr:hypothetical protein [Candidatus Omnitrophota bacterium]